MPSQTHPEWYLTICLGIPMAQSSWHLKLTPSQTRRKKKVWWRHSIVSASVRKDCFVSRARCVWWSCPEGGAYSWVTLLAPRLWDALEEKNTAKIPSICQCWAWAPLSLYNGRPWWEYCVDLMTLLDLMTARTWRVARMAAMMKEEGELNSLWRDWGDPFMCKAAHSVLGKSSWIRIPRKPNTYVPQRSRKNAEHQEGEVGEWGV